MYVPSCLRAVRGTVQTCPDAVHKEEGPRRGQSTEEDEGRRTSTSSVRRETGPVGVDTEERRESTNHRPTVLELNGDTETSESVTTLIVGKETTSSLLKETRVHSTHSSDSDPYGERAPCLH